MEIIKILIDYIESHKDKDDGMRFTQALFNLGIIQTEIVDGKNVIKDNFYEESYDTLERIRKDM